MKKQPPPAKPHSDLTIQIWDRLKEVNDLTWA